MSKGTITRRLKLLPRTKKQGIMPIQSGVFVSEVLVTGLKPSKDARLSITKRLTFEAGHRLPNHASKCRNLHGHHYALEITVEGPMIEEGSHPSEGMIADFSVVKSIANETVVEPWDHAFLVHDQDKELVAFLATIPNHKTVALSTVPTVENLALEAFRILSSRYFEASKGTLQLKHLRLYETPTCWADVSAP